MPSGLQRFQQSGESHFLTFSCYRRQANFSSPDAYDLFVQCLEDMRRRFALSIYGYVVMPEHVHLLVSEPEDAKLAEAIHFLKLSFAKRLSSQRGASESSSFWQKRYYDRNVRDAREFTVEAIRNRVRALLDSGAVVIIVDSAGVQRTGEVCRTIGMFQSN